MDFFACLVIAVKSGELAGLSAERNIFSSMNSKLLSVVLVVIVVETNEPVFDGKKVEPE